MKESRRSAVPVVLALLGLSLLVLGYGVYTLTRTPLAVTQGGVLFGFLLTALVFEVLAAEVPGLGLVSVALACYSVIWMSAGAVWALLGAFFALLARAFVRRSQPLVARAVDFAVTFTPVGLAAFAYEALAPPIDRVGASLPPMVFAALVAAMVLWFACDLVLCLVAARLLEESRREAWVRLRMRVRLISVCLVPFGFATLLLMRLVTPTAASGVMFNGWASLLMLLPLIAVSRAQAFMMGPGGQDEQEDLEEAAVRLRDELSDYKNQNRALMADLHKRVDEIAILRDMGQQLGASKDLDKTLEIIISMIRKLLIYQSCVIYLVDQKGALVPAKCISPYKDVVELSPLLQLEESMVNLVVQSKKPVLVSDMQGDSEHRIFADEKSIMCVPLIVKDVIIGVIYVGTLRPGTYNDDHVHVLETLANPAAIAIRSAQFHEMQEERLIREMQLKDQVQERVNQLNVLYHLGTDLNRCIKLADILDIITEKLAQLITFQSCILFVIRQQDGQMVAEKVRSPYEGLFNNFVASQEDEGIIAWVATNKRHCMVPDTAESRWNVLIERERSFMLLPLLAEDEVIGEIYVGAADAGFYDEEDVAVVEMVAAQAAMAIQKALLFEKTEGLAITDGVTGLYTHRYFQERLAEEVRWADRYERNLSLIMVDTDHFKKFNDTLGHPEGDKLLKEISALLRSYTRESDLVCRYGGDEFSLILKDTDKEAALKTGERIRDAFQLRFQKYPVKVTASIGVSNFPSDARSKTELVTAADAALYRSKQAGRNRVSPATPLDATQQPASH